MLRVVIAFGVLSLTPAATTELPVPLCGLWKLRPVVSPTGETLYRVHFDNLPFAKLVEELERVTGLMYLAKDTPDVKVTLHADGVCLAELFEQINEQLEPTNWALLPKTQSFSVYPADGMIGHRRLNIVTLAELPKRSREWVQLVLPVGEKGYEAGVEARRSIGKNTIELSMFGTDKLLVCGVGKEVQQLVAEMGDHIQK